MARKRKPPKGAGEMLGKISKPTKTRSSSNQTKAGSKGSFGRFGIVLKKKSTGVAKRGGTSKSTPASTKSKKTGFGNPGNAKPVGRAGEKGSKFNPPPSGPGTRGASDNPKKKKKKEQNSGGGKAGGGKKPKK